MAYWMDGSFGRACLSHNYRTYVHMLNMAEKQMEKCHGRFKKCSCTKEKYSEYLKKFMNIGREE